MATKAFQNLRDKIQKFRKTREPNGATACRLCSGTDGELIVRQDGSDACNKCSVICVGCGCYCDPDCVSEQSVCGVCASDPEESVTKFAEGEKPAYQPATLDHHAEPTAAPADTEEPPADAEESAPHECPNCHDDATEHVAVPHPYGEAHGCENCTSECEGCGDHDFTDDMAEAHNYQRGSTATICRNCQGSNEYPRCADCDQYYDSENFGGGQNTNAEPVCQSCGEDYFNCDACNSIVTADNLGPSEDGTICDDCWNRDNFHCRECDNNFEREGHESERSGVCNECNPPEPEEEDFQCSTCNADREHDEQSPTEGVCNSCYDADPENRFTCTECNQEQPSRTSDAGSGVCKGCEYKSKNDIVDVAMAPTSPDEPVPPWIKDPASVKVLIKGKANRDVVSKVFGRPVSVLQFAQMFGLVGGHTAEVYSTHDNGFSVKAANLTLDPIGRRGDVKHSIVKVSIGRDENGKLVIHNDLVEAGRWASELRGHASEIQHNQWLMLGKMGVHKIETNACVSHGDHYWQPIVENPDPENLNHWTRTGMVGGRFWPRRCGFGGEIEYHTLAKIPPEIKAQMKGEDVRDLLDVPGGDSWWARNGSSISEAYLEMDPESRTGRAHLACQEANAKILEYKNKRALRGKPNAEKEKTGTPEVGNKTGQSEEG